MQQGTLIIRGDKLIIREDKQGFQHSTSEGKPTTFKQKMEGSDDYIEGQALKSNMMAIWIRYIYIAKHV